MCDPFELIHDNSIVVEEAKRKCLCSSCNGKIFKKDIIATNIQDPSYQKLKYHLHCFRPLFETPIKDNQIKIFTKEPLHKNKIQNWIKNWNCALKRKDPEVNDLLIVKPTKFLQGNNKTNNLLTLLGRHNVIHIMLFLTIDEIIYIVKILNKSLYEISWSSHLWRKLCCRDFTREAVSALKKSNKNVSWVEEYFKLQKITCFYCKQKNGPDLKICPIEEKPICKDCRLKPGFNVLTLSDIQSQYGEVLRHIFDNFIEKYALTYFGDRVFYQRDIETAYKSYQNFTKNPRSI